MQTLFEILLLMQFNWLLWLQLGYLYHWFVSLWVRQQYKRPELAEIRSLGSFEGSCMVFWVFSGKS